MIVLSYRQLLHRKLHRSEHHTCQEAIEALGKVDLGLHDFGNISIRDDMSKAVLMSARGWYTCALIIHGIRK